jgi:hypothetical protein
MVQNDGWALPGALLYHPLDPPDHLPETNNFVIENNACQLREKGHQAKSCTCHLNHTHVGYVSPRLRWTTRKRTLLPPWHASVEQGRTDHLASAELCFWLMLSTTACSGNQRSRDDSSAMNNLELVSRLSVCTLAHTI